MRVIMLLLLLVSGCAVSQGRVVPQRVVSSSPYTDTIYELIKIINGADSTDRMADASGKLANEALGMNFEREIRNSIDELNAQSDTIQLMNSISEVAQYNPYVQKHKEAMELDLCRAITSKVIRGEIWLTASSGNFASCLQDRSYVEAIVYNSLKDIQENNSEIEQEALQALVARVPFKDVQESAQKGSENYLKQEVARIERENASFAVQAERDKISLAEQAASEKKTYEPASMIPAKVCLRVHPEKYERVTQRILFNFLNTETIQFVEKNNMPNTWTIDIIIDKMYSSGHSLFSDIQTYDAKDCKDRIARHMKEGDEYRFIYRGSKATWFISATIVFSFNKDMDTVPISLSIPDTRIECMESKIVGKDGRIPMHEYANDQMEDLCTKNKGTDWDEALNYFSDAVSKVISKVN